jgi:hypothetical protein
MVSTGGSQSGFAAHDDAINFSSLFAFSYLSLNQLHSLFSSCCHLSVQNYPEASFPRETVLPESTKKRGRK